MTSHWQSDGGFLVNCRWHRHLAKPKQQQQPVRVWQLDTRLQRVASTRKKARLEPKLRRRSCSACCKPRRTQRRGRLSTQIVCEAAQPQAARISIGSPASAGRNRHLFRFKMHVGLEQSQFSGRRGEYRVTQPSIFHVNQEHMRVRDAKLG